MRSWPCVIGVPLVVLACAGEVAAEPVWTYRARVSFEAQSARTNRSSPRARPGADAWDASHLFVASADSSWEIGSRLKLAGGIVAWGSSETRVHFLAREAYARTSVTSWMDVEAGKRLVRWGVGYGFSPTGVLDPPRLATDPTDRLGRHEGMPLVRADLFHGDTSLTIGVASPTLWRDGAPADAPSRVLAARVRTVLAGGLEVSLIGSAASGARASAGGNVTHVVGQRLEWHTELLVHPADTNRARTVSAVAGVQYTLPGVNVVMEYHRHGANGPPGGASGHVLFVRAARAGADVKIAPELIVIRAMNDNAWTTVAGLGWTVRRRVDLYARATYLAAPHSSRASQSPVSGTISLGATVRF